MLYSSISIVLSLLNSLKSHSLLYPVPLCLFNSISPYLIGFITDIINLSLITAVVPQSMKYSYITPLLKKPTLDHSNLANYIPISQLSSMSKALERVVSSQLYSTLLPIILSIAFKALISITVAMRQP